MSNQSNPSAPWKPTGIAKPGGSSSWGGTSLTTRPIHLQRMAEVVTTWATIEHHLTEMFAYVINAEAWVAAEIFEQVHSSRAKIGILRKYLVEKLGLLGMANTKETLDPLKDLLDERNLIAHGCFITSDSHPNGIIRVKGWGNRQFYFLYDLSTLDALVARFYECERAVSQLLFSVIAQTPARYEPGRWVFAQPTNFRAVGPEGNETIESQQPDGTWLRPDGSVSDE